MKLTTIAAALLFAATVHANPAAKPAHEGMPAKHEMSGKKMAKAKKHMMKKEHMMKETKKAMEGAPEAAEATETTPEAGNE